MYDVVKSADGQSVIDITMQVYKSIEGLAYLIADNAISVTDELEKGTEFNVRKASNYEPFKKFDESLDKKEAQNFTVMVEDGQCIWDMALQCYGTIESVMTLIEDNNLKMLAGTNLLHGDILSVKVNANVENKALMKYMRNLKVNTGVKLTGEDVRGGIGFMRIGGNFKVS